MPSKTNHNTNYNLTVHDVTASIINSLKAVKQQDFPYPHWLPEAVLPEAAADAVASLPFQPALIDRYGGRRNDEDDKRVYFNKQNREKFPVCDQIAEAFDSPEVRSLLEQTCHVDLSPHKLRIEFCQDVDGFWLEPHTDISVKKFTMLVYLSRDPALADAGTDIYKGPPEFEGMTHYMTAPYSFNGSLIFIPSDRSWHGVEKRKINGIRQSLIINFVTDDWREKWELAQA